MDQPVIHRVASLDLTVEPWVWPFARDDQTAIARHFAAEQARKPTLYNGKVLLMREPGFAGRTLSGRYFKTDFASFLSWRDFGFPGEGVCNAFGMGALRGADGTFLLGEMAAHTANAGKIYFPSGTPDLNDVVGDRVDIAGSIAREVAEETGLTAADYRAASEFHCVSMPPLLAIIQVLDLKATAAATKHRIAGNLAKQAMPELSAVHLVHDGNDIVPAMPRFIAAFIAAMTC